MKIGTAAYISTGPLASIEGIVQEVNDGVVTLAYLDTKKRLRTIFVVEELFGEREANK